MSGEVSAAALLVLLAAPAPPRVAVVELGRSTGLAAALASAGRGRPDVALEVYAPPAPPLPPPPPVEEIRRALGAAKKSFEGFALDRASKALDRALELIAPHARSAELLAFERDALVLQLSIAHATRDERELERAIAAYAERFAALPSGPSPWPPALVAKLEKRLPARTASLSVRADAEGAVLSLDGEPAGTAPATLTELAPGPHLLRATAPGRIPVARALTLEARASLALSLELPIDPAAALEAATIPLDEALSRALLEGAGVERAIAVVAEGEGARLSAFARGGEGGAAELRVPSRSRAELARALDALLGPWLPPEPEPPPSRVSAAWGWGVAGGGLALAAVGVALRVGAVGIEGELDTRAGAITQTEAFELQDRAETQAIVGTVLIAGGAALLAAVGAFLALEPP